MAVVYAKKDLMGKQINVRSIASPVEKYAHHPSQMIVFDVMIIIILSIMRLFQMLKVTVNGALKNYTINSQPVVLRRNMTKWKSACANQGNGMSTNRRPVDTVALTVPNVVMTWLS